MATERVIIQIESNIGEDGPLTVMDTLNQFMDAFELLSAAIAQEPGGEKVKWRLESLSKNSPATAVAVAYTNDPNIVVAPLVFRGKKRFASGMAGLADGAVAPWIADKSHLAKSLFKRNLNGVGRTVFDLEDDAPRSVLVERTARQGIKAIERHEAEIDSVDRSRTEYGTIDGHVAEAKTYHGKPAIYVRESLSGRTVPCILSAQLADEAGASHSWLDTWSGKRVRIKGELFYDRIGLISRVAASGLFDVDPKPVSFQALREIDLLQGATPAQHTERLWGYADE